jgi:hypothetical protein
MYSQQLLMAQLDDERKKLSDVRFRLKETNARIDAAKEAKLPKADTLDQLEQESRVLSRMETRLQKDLDALRKNIADLHLGTID